MSAVAGTEKYVDTSVALEFNLNRHKDHLILNTKKRSQFNLQSINTLGIHHMAIVTSLHFHYIKMDSL